MVNLDIISLAIDILGFVSAILIFLLTSRQERKAVEEQTRREAVRATLTEFAELRHNHTNFPAKVSAPDLDEDGRNALIKNYMTDLERFATGFNLGGYDLDVINRMSGGLLVRQYRQYFKPYIEMRRNGLRLDSFIKVTDLYCEVEEMIRQLHELRGEKWEPPVLISVEQHALEAFLRMPIDSPDKVFALFGGLPGAIERHSDGTKGFVYVPGTREDRCVLIAHADTYFDSRYLNETKNSRVDFADGVYTSGMPDVGFGADDRAGCAMLWLLRRSGHSLLILDGEEHGQVGANYIKDEFPEIFEELNQHTFMLELDKNDYQLYKTYKIPVTDEFRQFIEDGTGFTYFEGKGKTDIVALCSDVCGANFSVGYYNEHKPEERLDYAEWKRTYEVVRDFVAKPLRRFPVAEKAETEPEKTETDQ